MSKMEEKLMVKMAGRLVNMNAAYKRDGGTTSWKYNKRLKLSSRNHVVLYVSKEHG